MGIKQGTAIEIENKLEENDKKLLAFTTDNPDEERFKRLTNENNRYWSYLYAALHLKEFMDEWKKAGFPIDNKPGVLATLYNIGFAHSKPNVDPKVGGALIEFKDRTYSFGAFAHDIYYSDELLEEFPR